VLGPWVNSQRLNLFTGAVIWVLVMLSVVLTTSVMYPNLSGKTMIELLAGGTLLALAGYLASVGLRQIRRGSVEDELAGMPAYADNARDTWRMPPLDQLPPPNLTLAKRVWMGVLRAYLVFAVILVVVKVLQLTVFK
jgi:hypothetical protein